MRKYYSRSIGVGGASLLLIFVLLSFTTFATLSLISANADMKMVVKNAEAVTNYYAADSKAEEILAELKESTKDLGVWNEAVNIEIEDDAYIASYAVPIDKKRSLEVVIRIDREKDFECKIMQWKTVVEEEGYEDIIDETNLWDGEEIQVIP